MNLKDQKSMDLVWKGLIVLIGVSYIMFNIFTILSNIKIMPTIWKLMNVRSLIHLI